MLPPVKLAQYGAPYGAYPVLQGLHYPHLWAHLGSQRLGGDQASDEAFRGFPDELRRTNLAGSPAPQDSVALRLLMRLPAFCCPDQRQEQMGMSRT